MRILPMGHRAVLVADLDAEPAAWALALRALDVPGVVDVVPAAATVLIDCLDEPSLVGVRQRLGDVRVASIDDATRATVEIDVRYDGDDLDDVAKALSVDVDDVISIHTSADYRVAFCGFAPGFAYLVGTDRRLHVPRRSSPRTVVPAGSVAVAAGYTAVYPRPSPGGWNLLGTTEMVMFDPERSPPALLAPGTAVRFVAL
jgi:KipI family sensor histidine kinase inhibitor